MPRMKKLVVLCVLAIACKGGSTKTMADLSTDDAMVSNGMSDLTSAPVADLTGSGPADLAGSGGGTVTIHVFDLQGQADTDFVAWRDGDGAWQTLAHQTSGTYVLTVTDSKGRYGFAIGDTTSFPTAPSGQLLYATVADGAEQDFGYPVETLTANQAVTATFSNVPSAKSAAGFVGPYQWSNTASPGGGKSVNTALGTYDAAAFVNNSTADTSFGSPIIHHRAIDVGTTTSQTFDFSSGDATTPTMYTMSVQGAANKNAQLSTQLVLHSSHKRDYEMQLFFQSTGFTLGGTGAGTLSAPLLAPANVLGTDVQSVIVSAGCGTGSAICYVEKWLGAGADQTLTLPAAMTFSSQTFVGKLPSFAWNALPGTTAYQIEWNADNAVGDSLEWDTFITPAYLDGAAPTLVFPVLASVSVPSALVPVTSSGSYRGNAFAYGTLAKLLQWKLGGTFKPAAGDTYTMANTGNIVFNIP